jgi:hypothetical protein
LTDIRAHVSQLTQQLQTETDSHAVEQRKVEVLEKEIVSEKEKVASLLSVVERNKEVSSSIYFVINFDHFVCVIR